MGKVKITNIELNPETMKAKVSLFADDKTDVTSGMELDIPEGYTLDMGSSCMTSKKDFAFLDSSGTWQW